MSRILENVRVLDLTQYQAGPVCTMLLGDLGAEVIKIEPPWGDPMRYVFPVAKGESPYFLALNSSKKSITLNLKSDTGLGIFKNLVQVSDVVVENYAPGTMERLGIGYEMLKEVNPKVIFASISGFGQYGPYHKRLSFDIIAQAMSGYMSLTAQNVEATTGVSDIPPVLVIDSIGDTYPGTMCALSILAALFHRAQTGRGQRIDVAQLDSMVFTLPSLATYLTVGLTIPELSTKYRAGAYGLYRAKDRYVAIGAAIALMDRLAEAMGRESVDAEDVRRWVKGRTADEVVNRLLEARMPVAPVRFADEVVKCPHLQAREMLVDVEHAKLGTIKVLGFPPKFSETPGRVESAPPVLGQHTEEVLSTLLGYSLEEIAKLREEKAV